MNDLELRMEWFVKEVGEFLEANDNIESTDYEKAYDFLSLAKELIEDNLA